MHFEKIGIGGDPKSIKLIYRPISHTRTANVDRNLWLKPKICLFVCLFFYILCCWCCFRATYVHAYPSVGFVCATIYFLSAQQVGHCQRKLFRFRCIHTLTYDLSIWTPLPVVMNCDFVFVLRQWWANESSWSLGDNKKKPAFYTRLEVRAKT